MVDMPFMSYPTVELALRNSARLMQEGLAQMVKLEGMVRWWRLCASLAVTACRCACT